MHAVCETGPVALRRLDGEARLADAAGTDQGEQAGVGRFEQALDLGKLTAPADEWRGLGGQMIGTAVERLEVGELARQFGQDQLGKRFGLRQVLEPVRAEGPKGSALGQVLRDGDSCGFGQQDLAPVPSGGDARGPMHVDAHVAVAHQLRSARMEADPYTHDAALGPGMRRQDARRRSGGRHRAGCRREGHKEAVALGVDLDATVIGKRLAHQALMLGQDPRIGVAKAQEQLGGALDVAEEEGDGAGRQVRHGGASPRRVVDADGAMLP
jgi:hypothetical protein